ncbi:hypothetical protein Efla_004738 [Eimeria flavescens]
MNLLAKTHTTNKDNATGSNPELGVPGGGGGGGGGCSGSSGGGGCGDGARPGENLGDSSVVKPGNSTEVVYEEARVLVCTSQPMALIANSKPFMTSSRGSLVLFRVLPL